MCEAFPPLRKAQPGAHRNRHPAQHTGRRGLRRVEVAVCIEPDQTDAHARTVHVLQTAQHAGDVGAVAARHQDAVSAHETGRHLVRNVCVEQAQVHDAISGLFACAQARLGYLDRHARRIVDAGRRIRVDAALVVRGKAGIAIAEGDHLQSG